MKIDILTLFPNAFSYLDESIIKKAKDKNLIEINISNIRDYSLDKHKKCDDYPFGGGAGMLMSVQPIYDAIKAVKKRNSVLIFPSPKGKVFSHQDAKELATKKHLIFICGHYEGVDERLFEFFEIKQYSIGDFVLTGGELPSMVMIDSIARQIKGVISNESLSEESFSNDLLEYPQYTRPAVFKGKKVPEVLLSGNHQEIAKWRKDMSKQITKQNRPDLIICKTMERKK